MEPGAIFGIVWIFTVVPLHICFLLFFWKRRHVQPIKARLPMFVILTDVILILVEFAVCIQRIYVNDYPCLLNLWSGFAALIFLFNTYLGRCWTLYFKYGLTQERLKNVPKRDSFFVKHRWATSNQFLFKFFGSLTVTLFLPCAFIMAHSEKIAHLKGENCNRGVGDSVLAAYIVIYVIAFILLAWKLRLVLDGFKLKQELGYTAVLAIVIAVLWLCFNNFIREANREVFPFSSLFLLVGIATAFFVGTVWPIWLSYNAIPRSLKIRAEDFSTVFTLIKDPDGLKSFKQFMSLEFSVENVLFYEEIEVHRQKISYLTDFERLVDSQRLYSKYVLAGSPFQVSLPEEIVRPIEETLRKGFSNLPVVTRPRPSVSVTHPLNPRTESGSEDNTQEAITIHGTHSTDDSKPEARVFTPLDEALPEVQASDFEKPLSPSENVITLFDRAQEEVLKKMNEESFPRYLQSKHYLDLRQEIDTAERTRKVLEDLGLQTKES